MRVLVDRDLCCGYAICLETAPEVFDLDDDDIAVVIADSTSIEADIEAVELAVKRCPRDAIRIERDT
ncbi:MAG: ferredoxin [Gammaproteobacteria bacterium]|nr:ferredoxin [Gammaproteobacteria bacterium]